MKLHILGVSGPFPESGGATSGYLVEAGDTLLQLDLGSGVLARLTAKMPPESLSALFLSHWHFDHTADLTVLLYRLEALGKTLRVYAPVDESSAIRKIVASASCFDLTDVAPGDTVTVGTCTVRVGEARHPESWTEAKPHLSAALAASLAAEAGAERLVLTHLNPLVSPRLLLREAQALHPCVALASPGAVLDV